MKVLKYIYLFDYLVREDGFSPVYACKTIWKIRQLPDELKSAVLAVVEGKFPSGIEYHGVSLEELVDNEKMRPVRAILMLDWIRREPAIAIRYMETERYRAPQVVTESDREMLRQVLAKLDAKEESRVGDSEEKSEEDIVIGGK